MRRARPASHAGPMPRGMKSFTEHVVGPAGSPCPGCRKLPRAYFGNVGTDPLHDSEANEWPVILHIKKCFVEVGGKIF